MRSAATLALLCAACRLGVAGAQSGTPPRAGDAIRIRLHAGDERAGQMVAAGLAGDRRVGIQVAAEPACRPATGDVDYHVVAFFGSGFHSDGKCVRYKLSLSAKDDEECAEWKVTSQRSRAVFELRVYEAATCEQIRSLSREITQWVTGPKEESEPEALARVAARVPAALAGLFPDQVVVERPDQVARGREHGVADGAIYALFRERKFLGYLRVEEVGAQASAVEPLTCCFKPRAGDVLVSRGRHTLIDLVPVFAISTVDEDAVFGAGLHLRLHPMDGGWMFAVGGDLVGESDTDVWLTTLEGGYEWRPSARWEVAGLAGIGVGGRRDEADTETEYGVHGALLARGGYHILPYWFITFDAGVVTATYGLDGVVLRFGTGFRL